MALPSLRIEALLELRQEDWYAAVERVARRRRGKPADESVARPHDYGFVVEGNKLTQHPPPLIRRGNSVLGILSDKSFGYL